MEWNESFHGLDLNDKALLDKDVNSEPGIKFDVLVLYRYRNLPLKLQSAFRQFVAQANLVRALEQPRSKSLMNVEGSIDDSSSERIKLIQSIRFLHFLGFLGVLGGSKNTYVNSQTVFPPTIVRTARPLIWRP